MNDCPIAVGVENPHKSWMCRQPRNVRQTIVDTFPLPPVAPPIGDTSLTHVYEASGTFTYVTNANCGGIIIYSDPVFMICPFVTVLNDKNY
jgi:hypothetical protein